MRNFFRSLFLSLIISLWFPGFAFADNSINIPILCYHNFNPTVPGSMTLNPKKFEAQLKWLKENGYTIIPLKEAVEYLQGSRTSLPNKSIVITADDGWQSVYKYLVPIVKKYNIPVTLFIYPQTISQGKNAMTWDELKELQNTGLFDIQSHTWSHPNFKQERRRLSAANYQKFVERELTQAKKVLEEKMGKTISYLAWPFGIYDSFLEEQAKKAGYTMSFSIDARTANKGFRPMAQPRYMIIEDQSMQTFTGIAKGANSKYYANSGKNNRV
jgi:peptidoglycan/xylan/chitin deacetylase (PgdA/CDA1 family)